MTESHIITLAYPKGYLQTYLHSLAQIAAKYGVAHRLQFSKKNPLQIRLNVAKKLKDKILEEHKTTNDKLLAKHLHNHLQQLKSLKQHPKIYRIA